MKNMVFILLLTLFAFAAAACAAPQPQQTTTQEISTAPTTVPTTIPTTQAPATQPTTQPTTTAPTEPPITLPSEKPEGLVTEFPGPPADPAWFAHTLFIGDSRTVGLKLWNRSGNADYFCDVGLSVFNIGGKVLSDDHFTDMTIEQLLASRQYDKVFINMGLNEAWADLNAFAQKYQELYQLVRSTQPEAKIILQGIMSVGPEKAAEAHYYSPEYLGLMSQQIEALANGVDTFFIDVNFFFADSQGYLYTQIAAADHCHLNGKGYRLWSDWIEYVVTTLGF